MGVGTPVASHRRVTAAPSVAATRAGPGSMLGGTGDREEHLTPLHVATGSGDLTHGLPAPPANPRPAPKPLQHCPLSLRNHGCTQGLHLPDVLPQKLSLPGWPCPNRSRNLTLLRVTAPGEAPALVPKTFGTQPQLRTSPEHPACPGWAWGSASAGQQPNRQDGCFTARVQRQISHVLAG